MPQLEHVTISRNPIHDISPLGTLPKLNFLGVQGIPADDFSPLAGCTTLRYLDISGTKPRDLSPVSTLAGLEQLDVTAMDLTDLGFVSNLTKLRSLTANRNQIESLEPLRHLQNLQYIDLSDNRISDLSPLADIYAVERINLRRNRIEELTGFPVLQRNAIAKLAENRISDLRPLVEACRDSSDSQIELGDNRLGFESLRRGIHELEARGNAVFFKIEQKFEHSTRFPNIYVVGDAANHPEAELILAMVNRGTTDEELGLRFGLGAEAPVEDLVGGVDEPLMADASGGAANSVASADGVATTLESPRGSEEVLNVTLSTTGFKVENHIGEIVFLGLAALLIIVWKIPRRA